MSDLSDSLSRFAAALRADIAAGFRASRFDALALELFALQFAGNPAYRAWCESSGATPSTVRTWQDIPAVPAVAFKELELTCIAEKRRTTVFHSSGTTGQKLSRHWHHAESLALYESSLLAGFSARMLGPDRDLRRGRMVSLTPPPSQVQHSSLAHMMGTVIARWGDAASGFAGRLGDGGVWELSVEDVVGRLSPETPGPALVLGTAFGFVHLCDGLRAGGRRLRLPAGSRVMETGGYKGRSRELSIGELHQLIADTCGIGPEAIIREYGMSELSSQAYDGGGGGGQETAEFRFPDWVRVQVIAPETGRRAVPGATGLLRIWDLANVFSAAVVQTEDLAEDTGSGFRLVGRARAAEPRGCSLMAA